MKKACLAHFLNQGAICIPWFDGLTLFWDIRMIMSYFGLSS